MRLAFKVDDLLASGIYAWDTLYTFGANKDALGAPYLQTLDAAGLSRDPK